MGGGSVLLKQTWLTIVYALFSRGTLGSALNVPPTYAEPAQPILMNITGTGTQSIGNIAISAGAGTIGIGGKELNVLLYQNSAPWPGTQNVDYQGIATDGTSWYLLFFQCQGNGTLGWVFYENFDGSAMQSEPTTQSACAVNGQPTPKPVSFPAISMQSPAPTTEWSISGHQLSYLPGVGGSYISKNGTKYDLYPFQTVDCTSCGTPGWYELHSLFYDAHSSSLCFGIIYLTPSTAKVGIGYSLCLPELDQPLNGPVDSSFQGPLSR